MAIVQFTRFKGGKPEDMIPNAKKAKVYWEEHGAEWFRFSRFQVGEMAGQWLVSIRFPDWATYGKANDALAKNTEYQRIMADVATKTEIQSRSIAVGIDI